MSVSHGPHPSLTVLGIQGSPRQGNAEQMLQAALAAAEEQGARTELVRLAGLRIVPCTACRQCLEDGRCALQDDMQALYPRLLAADVLLVASPVFFCNVTAQTKAFIDRTWCLRGRLKDKVGGALVVGRRPGHEAALAALHAFFLKHEMILGHRGALGFAFEGGELDQDPSALAEARDLGRRVVELARWRPRPCLPEESP